MIKQLICFIGAMVFIQTVSSCELRGPEDDISCSAQGSLLCGGHCVSIMTEQHCGSCQKTCASGEVCLQKGGAYDCYLSKPKCAEDDHEFCGGQCVDITTKEHCGGCDPCKRYQRCEAVSGKYQCTDDCKSPSLICGNACLPPSRENCGECGNACGEARICKKRNNVYQCIVENCSKPEVLTPDGACVLPNTPYYCGDEAKSCPEETAECVPVTPDSQSFYCRDKCENDIRDPGESGIDCGGRCKACTKCAVNLSATPCPDGQFCDSAAGHLCRIKCRPDNAKPNTPSKDCDGKDQICRADGRCSSKYFITEWQTVDPEDLAIELFHDGHGACDFKVDWGDGKQQDIKGCSADKLRHMYEKVGTYRVKISGVYDGWGWKDWQVSNTKKDMAEKLTRVVSFGPVGLSDEAFRNCANLSEIPKNDVPDASKLLTMSGMFFGASRFNQAIEHWDVSNVRNFTAVFGRATHFNQPLNAWDVSSGRAMSGAFVEAVNFNQDLSGWDVSKVSEMEAMFYGARDFDQDLSMWNVDNVTNMREMFKESGLSRKNFCKMMQKEMWVKFANDLALPYPYCD